MPTNYRQLLDFHGKTALITGAARGLGAECARAFCDCGAQVILLDCDDDAVRETAASLGDLAVSVTCDVQDPSAIARAIASVERVDVLVNSAGIHRRVDPLDFNHEDVAAIFAVNLHGCLNMCSAVGRIMLDKGEGSIINFSALGGGIVGLGRAGCAYGMSKGGVVSLTRDLAAEWTHQGIRVNAVAPGWIRTPMTQELQNNEARSARVLERVPAQRWGEPADVAGVVLFLASPAAAYIAGHTIPVDGGACNTLML
jgi:NAD(P)-dependent dehydrogenase (short-subunit alcohol dehydrogenase family)